MNMVELANSFKLPVFEMMYSRMIVYLYINLRRSRDGTVFVRFVCYPRFIQFALASCYAACGHKRIVNIMKVYIERNNIQVE